MQAPRSLSSEQFATLQSDYTCLDTTRKRHSCPICEGTGKLTDAERRILLEVINLADWARDAQHQVEVAVAIQAITKLFLLGIGTLIGAAAMWIGGR